MSEITTMILEKQLKELMDDYKDKAAEVRMAQCVASIAEEYLREFIPVLVRESGGLYSEDLILQECGLTTA